MTRGKNKKDEIDMRSSPLSIEFADGVPQTYHKSTLRVPLSEQRGRDEVSRKRPRDLSSPCYALLKLLTINGPYYI